MALQKASDHMGSIASEKVQFVARLSHGVHAMQGRINLGAKRAMAQCPSP